MNKIIISTEDTCDLSKELLDEMNVKVMHMDYSVGDKEYNNGIRGITLKEFYKEMRNGVITKTSQINQFVAEAHFEEYLKQGYDVFHIAFDSALSNTFNSETLAAKELNLKYPKKVEIIDSLCASSGQGLLVKLCVDKLMSGASLEELKTYAEDIKRRIAHLFLVDNLKYLSRTGRVSRSTALIANAIKLKPVMHTSDSGKLEPMYKVLSRKRAIQSLIKEFNKHYTGESDVVYISNADCEENANYLADEIEKVTKKRPSIQDLGAVIGSHSGPGTLALFFVGDKR